MRIIKIAIKALLGILSLIILYGLIACILSLLATQPTEVFCSQREPIYITTNGVHLFFVLPTDIIGRIKGDVEIPKEVKYISVGWGDRQFYLDTPVWSDLRFAVAFRALFFRTRTALHLNYYISEKDSWHKIMLCESQYNQLIAYISDSFKRDDKDNVIEIPDSGYSEYDTFYEANGHYSIIKTSNNWVNIGLKRAEVATSIWSPFDKGVLFHIRRR